MKNLFITGVIIFLLIALNIFFQFNEYNDRKNLIITTHVEMEKYIITGIARSAEPWFKHNIIDLKRNKESVESEVFGLFVDPVKLFNNGDAWIYNKDYVIYDKSSDFPDLYRGKSIKEIFDIQKKSGASHFDDLVYGVLNATDNSGWYIWLPEKGKEWAAWTSVKIGNDTWTIGMSTPENEILEQNGMSSYLIKIVINTVIITILLIIILAIAVLVKKNEIFNQNNLLNEKNAAENANRTKSRFLANISHEIRTPINNVMGMTYLLSETDLTDSQREYVTLIQSSSDYLMETINQLLDISKIEAGKYVIENEIFDLNKMAITISRIFSINAQNKNLEFIFENNIDPDSFYIKGDQRILKHVLNNLLGNAVKYTNTGFVRFSLKTDKIDENRIRLIIKVEDSGVGIPKKDADKIFDYFYQVNSISANGNKGTGLGLTIVRDLVTLSGGTIKVESEPGIGSCFEVVIDYEKDEINENLRQPESVRLTQDILSSNRKLKRFNLLLAEDDRVSAIYVKNILKKIPCDLVHVQNGEEVLSAMKNIDFDIFIIDGQMPLMNGIETIKIIRRNERERNVKGSTIIALSAYAMTDEKNNFINAGADEYLSKPIMPEQIISVIKKYLFREDKTELNNN